MALTISQLPAGGFTAGAGSLFSATLPDTPLSASLQDHAQARRLHDRGISLALVESAFLLASLRRLARPADAPPLPPILSFAYFLPNIEELLAQPMPENYLDYLRLKLQNLATHKPPSADVQKIRSLMIANKHTALVPGRAGFPNDPCPQGRSSQVL